MNKILCIIVCLLAISCENIPREALTTSLLHAKNKKLDAVSIKPKKDTSVVQKKIALPTTAFIKGKIDNPIATKNGENFSETAIVFEAENLLFATENYEIIPDKYGNFSLTISLTQAMLFRCVYNDQNLPIFLQIGDTLSLKFDSYPMLKTVRYRGNVSAENRFLQAFGRKFETENRKIEHLAQMKLARNVEQFKQYCEKVRQEEVYFLNNYWECQQLSPTFFELMANETNYRFANRISTYFFHKNEENDNGEDMYLAFASEKLTNLDENIYHSNQYLTFLDNHLRHLCLRTETMQEVKKQPISWVKQAYNFAKQQFSGQILHHALAILAVNMINTETSDLPEYYRDFTTSNNNNKLKTIVAKQYKKLENALSAPMPKGANLHIMKKKSSMTFHKLMQKYKGKVVYIDFWASWCKPCLMEMPSMQRVKQTFRNKDVVFLHLSSDSKKSKWKRAIRKHNVTGEHYLMNRNFHEDASRTLILTSLPRHVLIDKAGNIVAEHAKPPGDFSLIDDINELLK
ncbi:MAG: thioredoxin-like domain-containing protein [Chitinophagales bacterium]